MTLTTFIILSVAVWWISRILTHEVGPYHIVEKFRNNIINEPWSPIYCLRCTSVWVSFFISLFLGLDFLHFILVWFGAAGAAIVLDAIYETFLPVVINQEEKKDGMQV